MMEMKFLGMDFSCALGALGNGEFPEKDCLLPLISKLLGYAIVAASTTVKLPQVYFSPAPSFLRNCCAFNSLLIKLQVMLLIIFCY